MYKSKPTLILATLATGVVTTLIFCCCGIDIQLKQTFHRNQEFVEKSRHMNPDGTVSVDVAASH